MLTTLGLTALLAVVGCKRDGGDDSGGTADGGADGGAATAPGDLLWLATGGGPADDWCASVVEADDGTVVAACAGSGFSTWGKGTAGEVDLTSVGGEDALLVGLDPTDGGLLWHRQIGSEDHDSVDLAPLARMPDGRLAALLQLGGPATVEGVDLGEVLSGDSVLFLLDSAGTVDTALRISSGPAFVDVLAWSLRPTGSGGLLIAGTMLGDFTLLPGTADEAQLAATGDYDTILIWLDADLRLDRLWRLGAQDTGDIDEVGVVGQAWPVGDGGAVVAGWFLGSMSLGQAAPVTLTSNPAPDAGDAFVALLDDAGEPTWAQRLQSGAEDYTRAVAETADGIVIAGYYNYGEAGDSVLSMPACAGASLTGDSDHSADSFVASLGPDGCPRWLHGISSDGPDTAIHLDSFDDGAVVVSSWGNLTDQTGETAELRFDDGGTATATGWTSLLVRYEADGSRTWTHLGTESTAYGAHVMADGSVVQANAFLSGAIYGAGQANEQGPLSEGSRDGLVGRFGP